LIAATYRNEEKKKQKQKKILMNKMERIFHILMRYIMEKVCLKSDLQNTSPISLDDTYYFHLDSHWLMSK